MNKYPKCFEVKCFAKKKGKCMILRNTNGYEKKTCPFCKEKMES